MIKPRIGAAAMLCVAALLCLPFPAARAQAQTGAQPEAKAATGERARGMELFQKGQYKEAAALLRTAVAAQKDDSEAWFFLGLALYRVGEEKGARQALETAVKLNPQDARTRSNLSYVLLSLGKNGAAKDEAGRSLKLNEQNAEAHYVLGAVHFLTGKRDKALQEATTALSIDPKYAPALLLKTRSLIDVYLNSAYLDGAEQSAAIKLQLAEAVESLERYLKANPQPTDAELWREQLQALRFYAGIKGDNPVPGDGMVYNQREVTVKARLISRAEPQYPDTARSKGIGGTVVLRAVLGADGNVRNILVIGSADSELTAASVRAARRIKFIPAQKDGKPVSQFVQIEYNYNVF